MPSEPASTWPFAATIEAQLGQGLEDVDEALRPAVALDQRDVGAERPEVGARGEHLLV
jgi:hypothetical protein